MNETILTLMQAMSGLLALLVGVALWSGIHLSARLDAIRKALSVSREETEERISAIEKHVERIDSRCMMINLMTGEKS